MTTFIICALIAGAFFILYLNIKPAPEYPEKQNGWLPAPARISHSQPVAAKSTSNHKQAAAQWAKQMLADHSTVIIDTETTGIDENAQVIEIGIINLRGEMLMHQRVKPIGISRMPTKAKETHGINISDLKNEPTFDEIAFDLSQVLKAKKIIAYNAEYDYRLLKQSAGAADIIFALPKFHCAMLQYAKFVGEWNEKRGEFKWQKLPSASHDAIGDCRATLEIIKKMAAFL